MDNFTLFLLNPLDEAFTELKEELEKEEGFNIQSLDLESIDKENLINNAPFVVLGSDFTNSLSFLTKYENIYKKSGSKFVLKTPKELSMKIQRKVKDLKISELLFGQVATKTLIFKAKLNLKALTQLEPKAREELLVEEGVKQKEAKAKVAKKKVASNETADGDVDLDGILGDGLLDGLISADSEAQERKKKEDEERRTFVRGCNKLLEEIEDNLDDYEDDMLNIEHLNKISNLFNKIIDITQERNFIELSIFTEIPVTICKESAPIQNETFISVVIGILSDTVQFIRGDVKTIANGWGRSVKDNPLTKLFDRFQWIYDKLEKANEGNETAEDKDHKSIKEIMELLGLKAGPKEEAA